MPDLDALLHSEPTSNMSDVADALGEGYTEHYQVALIRRYLLTDGQRHTLAEHDASVNDLLNGRIENFDEYDRFFSEWNAKLGRKVFGF